MIFPLLLTPDSRRWWGYPKKRRRSRLTDVAVRVCERHGIALADARQRGRRSDRTGPPLATLVRWECWTLQRRAGFTLQAIADWWGGFDHTSVIYGISEFEAREERESCSSSPSP